MRVIRESDDDVKRKDHLYYCKKCLKEQFETYGEGFGIDFIRFQEYLFARSIKFV